MKAAQKKLIAGTALLTIMGSSAPAMADSVTPEEPAYCTVLGQEEADQLRDQVCESLARAGEEYQMGKADAVGYDSRPGAARIYRLSTYYFAQHFERGWVVYELATGVATPMSNEVYSFWAQPLGRSFEANLDRVGFPLGSTTDSAQNVAHQGRGLTTIFQKVDGSVSYLQYVPSLGRVMDFGADFQGGALSWDSGIMVGDSALSPHLETAQVAKGIEAAGYTTHIVGSEHAAIAPNLAGLDLASQLKNNLIALPAGTPWVISVSATQADALNPARQETLKNARYIVQELRKVYPHSRIVFEGVMTAENETEINRFNAQLKEAVTAEGGRFVDTSGWITRYKLQNDLMIDNRSLTETGQQQIAHPMKWAIRYAIDSSALGAVAVSR